MNAEYSTEPGSRIRLDDISPDADSGLNKQKAQAEIGANALQIGELTHRLFAENARSLLIVLQGLDAAGKDGAIKALLDHVNAQSTRVTSFGKPSLEELDHDFLWRFHLAAPRRGDIAVFNRSHYEDVLIVRVRSLVPEAVWKTRYDRINEFERTLVEGGTTLCKFYLHISREEQRQRLQARLDDPTKRWKFRLGDLDERKLWDDYRQAADDALTRCNTEQSPWHVVPADRKWHRDLVIGRVVRAALEKMDPQFPPCDPALDNVTVE